MKFTTTIIKARRLYKLLSVNVTVETAKDMFNLMSNISNEEIESFVYIVEEKYNVKLQVYITGTQYNADDSMNLELCVRLDNLYANVDEEIIELLFVSLSYIQPDSMITAIN